MGRRDQRATSIASSTVKVFIFDAHRRHTAMRLNASMHSADVVVALLHRNELQVGDLNWPRKTHGSRDQGVAQFAGQLRGFHTCLATHALNLEDFHELCNLITTDIDSVALTRLPELAHP